MKLQINITKEILEESMYCGTYSEEMYGQNCAVGKAIFNLFGGRSWVYSTEIKIFPDKVNMETLNKYPGVYLIPLPEKATDFISVFDMYRFEPKERKKLTPLSFIINVPDGLINEIGISEVEEILAKSPALERVDSSHA